MRPTDTLKHEHRIIESVLKCLVSAAEATAVGPDLHGETFRDCVEFLRGYADHFHHLKEELSLFPALEERGIPKHGGPIGCMLDEHEEGRRLVAAMERELQAAEGGEDAARPRLLENAWSYYQLLSDHIQKEDQVLFCMVDEVLTADEQDEMQRTFGAAPDREESRLLDLARALCATWNVAFPEDTPIAR